VSTTTSRPRQSFATHTFEIGRRVKAKQRAENERPVAVGVRIEHADGDLVLFFPITTKQPERGRFAFEIPTIEKRRAGLDADRQLWLIMDEFNSDRIGHSFYIEPEPPIGRFSKAFFLPILREFIARRKSFSEVSRRR